MKKSAIAMTPETKKPGAEVGLVKTSLRKNGKTADGGKRTVRDLVTEAQDEATLAPLRTAAAKLAAEPVGRGPLLAMIGHPTHTGARDAESFQKLTGVPATSELDTVTWSGWLFRELQASKAVTDASPARRNAARKG